MLGRSFLSVLASDVEGRVGCATLTERPGAALLLRSCLPPVFLPRHLLEPLPTFSRRGGQARFVSNSLIGELLVVTSKWINLTLLSVAALLAMALWFSATAVVPQLAEEWNLTSAQQAWMTMCVQIGFVVGALTSALLNLADRMETLSSSQPARSWERPSTRRSPCWTWAPLRP